MKSLKGQEYRKILRDLKNLKAYGIIPSFKLGDFVKIYVRDDTNIYVYEHSTHAVFSSVTFTCTSRSCEEVKETQCLVESCTKKDHLCMVMHKPNTYSMRPYHS